MIARIDDNLDKGMINAGSHEKKSLNFSEALKRAKSVWNEKTYGGPIDYCCETEDAFLFSRSDYFSIGGLGPILVWKVGGGFGNYVAYQLEDKPEIVRVGYLSEFLQDC